MLHRPERVNAQAAGDERDKFREKFTAQSPWDQSSRDLPCRQFIFGKSYLLGSVSTVIAEGGVGKTSLVITEAVAMVTGRNLLGVQPKWKCGVRALYWNGEEPREEIERHVHAICILDGIDLHELTPKPGGSGLLIASGHDVPICIANAGRSGLAFDNAVINEIEEFIIANEIEVAIFDPFVSMHAVSENDNAAINGVIGVLKQLATRCGISIMVVHHTRKPLHGGTVEHTVADARGASALIDAVRDARVLNAMSEAEGRRARVKNHRMYFRADNGKSNYAPPAEATTWYQIVPVTLPNGDDWEADVGEPDQPGDSVGVVTLWRFPQVFDGVTADHMRRVREIARAGDHRADPQAENWIGNVVAEVLDLEPSDKNDRTRIRAILKAWIANGVLKVVQRRDETRRERSFVEPGEWSDG